jgi:hypothetical protein
MNRKAGQRWMAPLSAAQRLNEVRSAVCRKIGHRKAGTNAAVGSFALFLRYVLCLSGVSG